MSAFFQDITRVGDYLYAYNENKQIILNENTDKLVNFFLKFDWPKFNHLSVQASINFMKDITKENTDNIKLNRDLYYTNIFTNKFNNKKFKLLII